MTEQCYSADGVGDETESFVPVKQETGLQSQSYQTLGFDEIVDEVEIAFDPLAFGQDNEDPLNFNNVPNLEVVEGNKTNESTMVTTSSVRIRIVASHSDVDEMEERTMNILNINNEPSELPFQHVPNKFEPTCPSEKPDAKSTCITYVAFKPTQKTFLCTLCGILFHSDNTFQNHLNQFHGENLNFTCEKCGKKFKTKEQMKRHATIHDPIRWQGKPKYVCEFCGRAYHLQVSLNGHRKEKHLGYVKPKPAKHVVRQHHAKGVRNPRPEPKPEKTLHPCPLCDLIFQYKNEVRKHMIVHTGERRFKCDICGQPCVSASTLRVHMKTVHLNPTTGPRPSRPKFMCNQPCPCTICDKVFKTPSLLKKHMLLHTGEKPHECDICGAKFRLTHDLRRHKIKHTDRHAGPDRVTYKCMVCGKDKFPRVQELRAHRVRCHPLLPYDSEKERAFACGICGKPWFTKEQAMVCTILRHDPTSLLKEMFKIKCPACPDEHFGHRSTYAVRKHWEEEHQGQMLPATLRQGMYQSEPVTDVLPNVVVNMEMKKDILENGYGSSLQYEHPLYVQLDLVDAPQSLKKRPRKIKERMPKKNYNFPSPCTICGIVTSTPYNLKRHLKRHKNGAGAFQLIYCSICNKRFRKMTAFEMHQKVHETKAQVSYGIYCPICNKGFRKKKTLQSHQKLMHKTSSSKKRKPGRRRVKKKQKLIRPIAPNLVSVQSSQSSGKRKPGRPRKNPVATQAIIQQAINSETSSDQPLEPIPIQHQDSPMSQEVTMNDSTVVCCNDAEAVAKVLENKTARVVVTKCDADAGKNQLMMGLNYHDMFEKLVTVNVNDAYAVQTILQHRCLKVVLYRCTDYFIGGKSGSPPFHIYY